MLATERQGLLRALFEQVVLNGREGKESFVFRASCIAVLEQRSGAAWAWTSSGRSTTLPSMAAEVAVAVAWAFKMLKLVVEPGGAVSLAAVLAGKVETSGLTTAVVLSGGNIDPSVFSAIIEDRFLAGA